MCNAAQGDPAAAPAAKETVIFVIPPDRGHFDYTVFIAERLHGRGYAVEYWSPSTAGPNVPAFASFHPLHEAGDDRSTASRERTAQRVRLAETPTRSRRETAVSGWRRTSLLRSRILRQPCMDCKEHERP